MPHCLGTSAAFYAILVTENNLCTYRKLSFIPRQIVFVLLKHFGNHLLNFIQREDGGSQRIKGTSPEHLSGITVKIGLYSKLFAACGGVVKYSELSRERAHCYRFQTVLACNNRYFYAAASSMFSIKMPYPVVGSFTRT